MNMDLSKKYVVPFEILSNSIEKNKLSHAYLFSGDKKSLKLDMAKYFVKMIYCTNKQSGKPCDGCYYCDHIDEGSFPDLVVVDPEGLVIKKEDILKIQEEFSRKSTGNENRVYIINNAERMNKQAANALLKFLEEPEEGIIGILISDNSHELLDTIVSRCQRIMFSNSVFKLNSEKEILSLIFDSTLENEIVTDEKVFSVIKFVEKLEEDSLNAFLFEKPLVLDVFKTKEEFDTFINLLTLFYVDVVNSYYKKDLEVFIEEKEIIEKVLSKNDINVIIEKVKTLVDIASLVKYNTNLNLLLDKLIFTFKEERS